MNSTKVIPFFDTPSNTLTYILIDETTKHCAIIDSVLDFDNASGTTNTASADQLISIVNDLGLTVEWILETHVHADHLSAAPYLKTHIGGKIGIGGKINEVQAVFSKVFNAGNEFAIDGSQFDILFADNDVFQVGSLDVTVMHTPGHTPACVSYLVDGYCFVGDTFFMPDFGTARCDFPGGDAQVLYQSLQHILSLPDDTKLIMCHDYMPGGRELEWKTTVAETRASNVHIANASEAEFVTMRTNRDKQLPMPKLLIPSVQVNMRAGEMPAPEANGVVYLKTPINLWGEPK